MKKCNVTNFLLTIVFGLMVIISFVLLCCNLDSSEFIAITSAVISLSGGGLVSVIVTWFINHDEHKNKMQERELIRNHILLPTYNLLLGMIYNFSRLCKVFGIADDEEKGWKEWLDLLIVNIAEPMDLEMQKQGIMSITNACNNVKNRIDEIRSQRIALIIHGLIADEEYYALCELEFIFRKIIIAQEQNDIRKFIDELCYFSGTAGEIFQKIHCGVDLNNIKFDKEEFYLFTRETSNRSYVQRKRH